MRAREMHPLCCIAVDCPGLDGARSPAGRATGCRRVDGSDDPNDGSSPEGAVAGILYKWTNYGKGWRSRWFTLSNGVLSYSKARVAGEDVRLIGGPKVAAGRRKQRGSKPPRVVHLKISSFRESRSDERRFYIFSATKTLHLKTDSRKDRVAWIEALLSARSHFLLRPLNDQISFIQNHVSLSSEKLRKRLLEEGLCENLVKDCEQIMVSELSQLKHLYEGHLSLVALGQLEEVNTDTEKLQEGQLSLKNGFSSSGRGKYSEYSTTESSDDIGRQELDDLSEDDEPSYFDTLDSFLDSAPIIDYVPLESAIQACKTETTETNTSNPDLMHAQIDSCHKNFPYTERRTRLPNPIEKEKGVSLWSMIKDNVGKDLTRVCLPVYFNEPLSSLQKCFEDLEYSYLLDQAYDYGKQGNSLMRILYVAAFAVSGYASSDGRPCKPFNPLLGETYEADYPEKGVKFFSEKVSHHPMLVACHCEGRGWKFWGDSNLRSKFWGRSIQLDPVGILTLEFDDGEVFQWSKVTTSIYNLIIGKVYCDHHGTMNIQGNREYSCKLRFKEQSILDRNPHQVQGFVEDISGTKVATLIGKWDDSMYYVKGCDNSRKFSKTMNDAMLLWRRSEPAACPTRYNLSSFAITLNELTSELQEKLPPTDSRHRPDQRHLENGEYEKANTEKLRLETRQRMSRKLQENGWRSRWFHRDGEDGTFRYIGGYWEGRKKKDWNGCPNIFGDLAKDTDVCSFK